MDFFGHDVNKFLVFAGEAFKNKKPKAAAPSLSLKSIFGEEDFSGEGGEGGFNWWNSWDAEYAAGEFAFSQTQFDEILKDLDSFLDSFAADLEKEMGGGSQQENPVDSVEIEMQVMQQERRRQSIMQLQQRLSVAGADGRRMSRMDAKQVILDSAVELAKAEDAEDEVIIAEEAAAPADDDEEPPPPEEPEFIYLPYVVIEGDEVDQAVGNLVNTRELDLHIIRPNAEKKSKRKVKTNKAEYKVGGVSYTVRCIHGLLIAKRDDCTKWDEFEPTLVKLYEESKQK